MSAVNSTPWLLVSLIVLLSAETEVAFTLPPAPPLAPHPRLILTPTRLQAMRQEMSGGGSAAMFAKMLMKHADWALTQPPTARGKTGPTGVLIHVRTALDIMLTTALAASLNGTDGLREGTPYFDRSFQEANQLATNWSDWNFQAHALDTGEATMAVGLVYDWLYQGLSTSQRSALLNGVVNKGLVEYQKYIGTKTAWWVNNTINWNCVCSAGGVIGTLATMGDPGAPSWSYDEVAGRLIAGVVPCVAAEHEDSSWEEGPGYWGYANKYNVWLFSALLNVFNSTLGLGELPGVEHAARFPLYSSGANGVAMPNASKIYNWADAGSGDPLWIPFSGFWGTHFDDGAAAYFSRASTISLGPSWIDRAAWGGFVEASVFYDAKGEEKDIVDLPTSKLYDFINVGIFRSPWLAATEYQNYLGFKGGDTKWNHNHLDLGSFVFDFAGARIAGDMGSDSYALPGYFDPKVRWTYYRLNSHGHNVPLFGNVSQIPATANITTFNGTQNGLVDGFAIIDISDGYSGPNQPSLVRRGYVSLNMSAAVIILDEYTLEVGSSLDNITWQMHARCRPNIDSLSVELYCGRYGKVKAVLSNLPFSTNCPALKGWSQINVTKLLPDPPFESATGWSRLDLLADISGTGHQCNRIANALGDARLLTNLQEAKPGSGLAVRQLNDWVTKGPLY